MSSSIKNAKRKTGFVIFNTTIHNYAAPINQSQAIKSSKSQPKGKQKTVTNISSNIQKIISPRIKPSETINKTQPANPELPLQLSYNTNPAENSNDSKPLKLLKRLVSYPKITENVRISTGRNTPGLRCLTKCESRIEQKIRCFSKCETRTEEKAGEHKIKVVARVRPLNQNEQDLVNSGLGNIIVKVTTPNTLMIENTQTSFILDGAFEGDNQQNFYEKVAKDTINEVMCGYNGTIFAYGPTGTGKTYSMIGSLPFNDYTMGIVPRTANYIFDQVLQNSQNNIEIRVSALEIYKENLQDLLVTDHSYIDLRIKESSSKGIYVEGLLEKYVNSKEEFLNLIRIGTENRVVAETKANEKSSRSHTLFMLRITEKFPNGQEKQGKLNLVDLAGSEKLGYYMKNKEDHIEETKKINKSLSALGNVIFALTNGSEHIPYRDSKLTRILQESLGGNYKTTLIITMSPFSGSLDQTLTTLKFAQRASHVKNRAHQNICSISNGIDAKYEFIINGLKYQLKRLQDYIKEKIPESDVSLLKSQYLEADPYEISASPYKTAPMSTKNNIHDSPLVKEYKIEIETQKAIIEEYEETIKDLREKLEDEKIERLKWEQKAKSFEAIQMINDFKKTNEKSLESHKDIQIEILTKELNTLTEALEETEDNCRKLLNERQHIKKQNSPEKTYSTSISDDLINSLKSQLIESEIKIKSQNSLIESLNFKLKLEEQKYEFSNSYSKVLENSNQIIEKSLYESFGFNHKLRKLFEKNFESSELTDTVLAGTQNSGVSSEKNNDKNSISIGFMSAKGSKVPKKSQFIKYENEISKIDILQAKIEDLKSELELQASKNDELQKCYESAKISIDTLKNILKNTEQTAKNIVQKEQENNEKLINALKEKYENELKNKQIEIRKLYENIGKMQVKNLAKF